MFRHDTAYKQIPTTPGTVNLDEQLQKKDAKFPAGICICWNM